MLEMNKDGAANYEVTSVEEVKAEPVAEMPEQPETLIADLQRLTNHVNRELGVAQDTPLHERLTVLEEECKKNFRLIGENSRLLKQA